MITPKWKVIVAFDTFGKDQQVFWVYDASIATVLRQVSDMQFTENSLPQPVSICVVRSA